MLKFSECSIRGNWFTWVCDRGAGGIHVKMIQDWGAHKTLQGKAPSNVGIYLPCIGESIEGTQAEIESIIDWIVERT